MKISINPVVLLRIPAFALTDCLEEEWEALKLSISQSSAAFYEKIRSVQATELKDLDFKVQFTIWKYFNRARFRGTPYGSFAGIATGTLTDREEEMIFTGSQHLHRFKDWSYQNDSDVTEEELMASERLYFANTSNYGTTRTIRFLTFQDELFELAEIEYSTFISDLLAFCSKMVSYNALCDFAKLNEVTEEVLLGILKAMIEMQLIFTDLNPNMIGPDYFERTGQDIREGDETYLIAERKVLSGGLNKALLTHIPACIDYLSSKVLNSEAEDFMDFKRRFVKRFDAQQIPLMRALDPELGIGYGDLEGNLNSFPLDVGAQFVKKEDEGSFILDTFARQLLKSLISGKGDPKQVIRLEQEQYKGEKPAIQLPNSFSALVRVTGDLLIIDHLGGCTANALLGRFTMANATVETHCREMAAKESAANPDVIFFDVAYMAERKVDNINRRKGIYDYELPILNYSCSSHPIALNDLLVTVRGNEVLLFSEKYGKRLVPRLASAYNYSRSDLSVYRFLCDLQHQGIQTQLLFDVERMLPGLDFYPRIQYENLILSMAKWRIRQADVKREGVSALLQKMGVGRYFTAGTGDQTLCFDSQDQEDLIYFKNYSNQYNDFVITDVIVNDNQLFKCVDKKNYFAQVLLTLSHDEKCYAAHFPTKKTAFTDASEMQKVIVPGKDWLYFELYAHPQKMNFILRQLISRFVSQYGHKFKTWFFIRYNDPAPHLRLRFQLAERKGADRYVCRLMELLSEELADGIITDVQLKTYHRETERYGWQQMSCTEAHFSKDSAYAIHMLEENRSDDELYANCIALMKAILPVLGFEERNQLAFIRAVQQSFEKEHQMHTEDFKKVNKSWSLFSVTYDLFSLDHIRYTLPQDLLQSFKETLEATAVEHRADLFCSLFHMHINRLFTSQQRTHELMIYSFLYKDLQREKQRLFVLK